MKLTDHDIKVLQYAANTNGNATMDIFEDDWAPIGRQLLFDLGPMGRGLIHMPYDSARGQQFLHLTEAGRRALQTTTQATVEYDDGGKTIRVYHGEGSE